MTTALSELLQVLTRCVREIDLLARYGGEEFLVILPQTHFSGSLAVAERIWRTVAKHEFNDNNVQQPITVSVGISFYPNKNIATVEQLVAFADQALYQAKREARQPIASACIST